MAAFFFFQAEDGIRDADVTGVQTCALPISQGRQTYDVSSFLSPAAPIPAGCTIRIQGMAPDRSEERRVGKECRFWWLPSGFKKNSRGTTRTSTLQRITLRKCIKQIITSIVS